MMNPLHGINLVQLMFDSQSLINNKSKFQQFMIKNTMQNDNSRVKAPLNRRLFFSFILQSFIFIIFYWCIVKSSSPALIEIRSKIIRLYRNILSIIQIMSITLFKKQVQESSLSERIYQHQIKNDEVEKKQQAIAKPKKTMRQIKEESSRKNQEKVLLRKVKHQPEWKQKKSHTAQSEKPQQEGGVHFKSQLEKIYHKEQKAVELAQVKQQARREIFTKAELSKNISKIIMGRMRK